MTADDWATVAGLATALGTLVLAVATFSAVRSANRTARAAERSLLAGLRPVLMASPARRVVEDCEDWYLDLLYGDQEGGQRVITRFRMELFTGERGPRVPGGDRGPWLATVARHWNLDRRDPR